MNARGAQFTVALLYLASQILGSPPSLWSSGQKTGSAAETGPETVVIRHRYVESVLPTEPAAIESLRWLSDGYAQTLGPEGTWPDIDYQGVDSANWAAVDHLTRTVVLAKAARLDRDAGRRDAGLDAKVLLALQAWDNRDPRNPNWWWNQIGVPELVGEIASLMFDELPDHDRLKVIEIMKRSNWREGSWTGANLIWGAEIEVVRGCLEGAATTLAEAYGRMYEEIKIVTPAEEGIQQDDSFHQHGRQLYNGGYGRDFANDLGRFITIAWGTRFQIPAARMAIYSSYLLDGEQWLVRGDVIDYSTVGREITREEKVVAPRDRSASVISPAGPANSLATVVAMLARLPVPRQADFAAFAARLRNPSQAPDFTGNKQFWCSDFMAHRRAAFYTSVKMLSTRMQNAELVDGEGKKSQHLSDGVNFLYLTGDEYKNIFPVWDWTRLPGITAIQGALEPGDKNAIHTKGGSAFAGGVSDGRYGAAAMDLARGHLTAKKAWFFFDEGYVALGAGITLSGEDARDVVTDVNQTLLAGEVFTNQGRGPIPTPLHPDGARKLAWVYHHKVGYVFPPDTSVAWSAGPQSGKWSDIGAGSDETVTTPVFELWIDHGRAPRNAAYQYTVLPGLSRREVSARAAHPRLMALANTEGVQAVYSPDLKLVEAVFRQAGPLATPLGPVTVDHPCLLMVREAKGQWHITAANPLNEALTLRVHVNGLAATMELPGGNFAGSSVTTTISALDQ